MRYPAASAGPALALLCSLALAACSTSKTLPGDDAPTLARLLVPAHRVQADAGEAVDEARAIAAYQAFLEQAPGSALAPQVPLALRRLGDLEMDLADRRSAQTGGGGAADQPASPAAADPDYSRAIHRYQALLQAHPDDPGNDAVRYQLARAQDQAGQLEAALATLTQLVQQHPGSPHVEEVQFRRGETLFALARYADAEAAYSAVLGLAPAAEPNSPYTPRALYMQGWSRFKQGDMAGALPPLFAVLDTHLGTQADSTAPLAELPGLSRAQRELVQDTLRVASIALANLEGGASMPAPSSDPQRQAWRWRAFDALASLYTTQDRPKDAADTLALFAQQQPLHAQAPVLLSRVVHIHEQAGFTRLALQAKTEYVERYGVDSAFRRANPDGWTAAQPLVQTHLEALARHHHALSQRLQHAQQKQQSPQTPSSAADKATAQAQAIRWYRLWLASFPQHPRTPGLHFLLAELLTEAAQHGPAATAFEAVAYRPADAAVPGTPPPATPPAPRAEAGYAALLAHAALVQAAPDAATRAAAQQASADSALRFADAFGTDARSAAVLVNRADLLFQLGQAEAAALAADRALAQATASAAATTPLTADQRRTAHTVLAHSAFERAAYAQAESAYAAALAAALVAADTAAGPLSTHHALAERQAVAIYRQGEAARTAGQLPAAVLHFERVALLASSPAWPATSVSAANLLATAHFDAATTRVQLQDWPAAASALESFRLRHRSHPLQAEVPAQLAAVYLAQQRWTAAAGEFERIAASASGSDSDSNNEVARSARWQVAELHDKALALDATAALASSGAAPPPARRSPGAHPNQRHQRHQRGQAGARAARQLPALPTAVAASAQAWERYLAAHPQPLEPALQARLRLATLLARHGQPERAASLHTQVLAAEAAAGDARTPGSRQLAGQAALALAERPAAAYRSVALVEPLARQLKLKQQGLQRALQAYSVAAETGVADITTAASFHTAALYQDFGQALLQSQRPKKLSAAEREQYDVLLEEQAFPFEEKAIALHEANTARSASGVWGPWVQRSFEALARLKPARYGKTELWPATEGAAPLSDAGNALTAELNTELSHELSKERSTALRTALAQRAAGHPAQAARTLEAALAGVPPGTEAASAVAAAPTPALWTTLGLLYREAGRFADARRAYESALAAAPDHLAAQRNLAVLHDLYLNAPEQALPLFQRCLALVSASGPDANTNPDLATYTRWVAEVQRRQPGPALRPATNTAAAATAAAATQPAP